MLAFLYRTRLTYPQFEVDSGQPGVKWMRYHSLNNSITGYIHDDATRQGILSANGLADGDPRM